MRKRLLKVLLLSGKEVLEVEAGTCDVPVLEGIDVEIGFTHNISKNFTKMKWRIKVEEKFNCFDNETGRIEVQKLQDKAAGENPLHWYWIKNETVS